MRQKSCFFIGHRETPEEIYPVLCAAVEEHIVRYGVTEFIVGHYGCFDCFAAKAVKTAKQAHPEVELTLLLPYHPAERRYMVDHTDFLIAYAWHPASNARDLLEYARKRESKGLIHVTALPHIDL